MLDFKLESKKYMLPLECMVAFMRHGSFEIELFRHDKTIALPKERLLPNSDIRTQGTKHICFGVSDVFVLLASLKEKGVEIVLGPQQMEHSMMGFIHDNNRVLIEFIQQTESE